MASPTLLTASTLLVPPPVDADGTDSTEILAGRDLALELLAHPLEPSPAACSSTFLSHPELQAAVTLGTLRALGVLDRALVVVVRGGVSRPAVLCALPDEAEGDAAAPTLYCRRCSSTTCARRARARPPTCPPRAAGERGRRSRRCGEGVHRARPRARAGGALSVARGANAAEERLAARASVATLRAPPAVRGRHVRREHGAGARRHHLRRRHRLGHERRLRDDARGGGGGSVLDGTMTMLFGCSRSRSKSGVIEPRGSAGGVASVRRGEDDARAPVRPRGAAPPTSARSSRRRPTRRRRRRVGGGGGARDAIAVALSSSAPPASRRERAAAAAAVAAPPFGGGRRQARARHPVVRRTRRPLLRSERGHAAAGGEAPKPSALAAAVRGAALRALRAAAAATRAHRRRRGGGEHGRRRRRGRRRGTALRG